MKFQVMTYNIHGLPWSKNQSREIVRYLSLTLPDVLCLQEVFTDRLRVFFVAELTALGYTVVVPRDEGVTLLRSGLLTAVHRSRFRVLSSCFYPYTVYHNLEIGANKGFHTVRASDGDGRRVLLVNTHTQSDTMFSAFGVSTVSATRLSQCSELVRWLEKDADPVILAGDMNCEVSPHPHLRFLRDPVLRKATLPSTGEDIDHVAWIPTQWAPVGTAWCAFDTTGVKALAYRVDPIPWSDHFPVIVNVALPEIRPPQQGPCGSPSAS